MSIEEIYDQHINKVYTFFYIKCLDKTMAEDLTSQTFMAVVEKTADPDYIIQEPTKFVYGVMRNVWLTHLRAKYSRREQLVEDMEDFGAYVEAENDEYEGSTVKQRAEIYINRLPDRQRDVLTMRLLEGLSIKDICAATSKDSNYVKTTYKRGLKRLKQLIELQEPNEMPAVAAMAGKETI